MQLENYRSMDVALGLSLEQNSGFSLKDTVQVADGIWVIDNFYTEPHAIREQALALDYGEDEKNWSGNRSQRVRIFTDDHKVSLERLVNRKIDAVSYPFYHCSFQYCREPDRLCIHSDPVDFGGVIFLTPNAPQDSGTSFFRHENTGLSHMVCKEGNLEFNYFSEMMYRSGRNMFDNGKLNNNQEWETVYHAENVFNRFVLFDATRFHSAARYFGTNKADSRLTQNVFITCKD